MGYIDTGIRYVNERRHECGCLTRFDVVGWRSVVAEPCARHEKLMERERERVSSPTNQETYADE